MLLSKIIEQYQTHIADLSNIRAMIDFKFETQTKQYFIFQQFIYLFIFVIPFFALNTWALKSWIYLMITQLSQLIFFSIELLILWQEGWIDYFDDITNLPDWIQFISHTLFFILKVV